MAYESEQEQLEALKKWWQENGKFVIAGLVLGAAAVFGWRAWEDHQRARAAEAAGMMEELSQAAEAGEFAAARELGAALVAEYDGTPYAAHAALVLAELAVRDGETAAAREHLQWVLEHAADEVLQLAARLRLAGLLQAAGEHEAALRLLGLARPGAYAPLYAEARGDIHAALGETDKARAAYQEALTALEPGMGDRALLQMKLDNLPQVAE